MSLAKFLKKRGKAMPRMDSAHGEQSKPMEDSDLDRSHGMKVGEGMEHLDYGARDELASKRGDPDHGNFMSDMNSDAGHNADMDEIESLLHDVKQHIAKVKDGPSMGRRNSGHG